MADTATFDFQPVQDEAPPAFDFQPEAPAEPPMPSVRDLMKMSQPWTTRQNASADIDRATSLPASPTLPPAQNRLSIAPPHQGTATQEFERQAGPPLTLQPTAKPTPLAPPPANANQITPVPRPALGQPTLPAPQDTEPKQNVTLVSTGFGTSVHPDLLNSRFAYVSISRASQVATLFTDDLAKLRPQLGADVSKTSALEINQGSSLVQGIAISR